MRKSEPPSARPETLPFELIPANIPKLKQNTLEVEGNRQYEDSFDTQWNVWNV